MTTLPPHLRALEADLASAAGRRVRQLRRRRRLVNATAVATALLVMTGAGLAASGAGIFGWLASGEPGEARFSVDAGRVYRGAAPERLRCEVGGEGALSCGAGAGERVYELLSRVERPEIVTRRSLLELLAAEALAARVSAERAERSRALVLAVPDDFFAKLSTLLALRTIGASGSSSSGDELVPPRGVPLLVVCDRGSEAFSCRDLAGAEGVAVGAPVYRLRETPDWVGAPPGQAIGEAQVEFRTTVESVWARPLSDAERSLLSVFATPATSGAISEAEVASPPPVTATAP